MVYFRENPIKMDDLGPLGGSPISGKPHMTHMAILEGN
jgi:hypothetical protein